MILAARPSDLELNHSLSTNKSKKTMPYRPSPGSSGKQFLKLLRPLVPMLTLAALIACGAGGPTSDVRVGGGGGGGAPRGASSLLFASDFNSLPTTLPSPFWCPTDSIGNVASITTLRIWDSEMKWSDIETSDGAFDWTRLDNTINNLVTDPNCTMGVIYTVGSIPQWATACGLPDPGPCLPGPTTTCSNGSCFGGGTECSNSTDWSCLPPSDVNGDGTGADAQFQTYISALATRYGSSINYYEVWNEADSPNFWCPSGGGSPSTCGTGNASVAIMVRMAWDLYNIVHCASSTVKVLSPSFHGDTAASWMHNYATTSISAPAGSIGGCSWAAATVTGLQTFDITNFHGRGSPNSDPTQFLPAYQAVAQEMQADGLPTDLFDDENGYIGTAQAANPDIQAAYVAISYVLRASVGPPSIELSSWYAWDAPQGPLQGTIVGLSYDVVAGWLSGSSLSNCTILGTLYSCLGTSKDGTPFDIMWDTGQNCNNGCTTVNQAVSTFSTWTDLTGAQHQVSGGTAPVGYQPIILE
jgi:hypothetical protein